MKTFFTADPHYACPLSFRKFASPEEHDDELLEQTNATVGSTDRLFILGDFGWRHAQSYVAKINCRNIHLIFGNHDKGGYSRLFKTVCDVTEIKLQGHKVWLSHYAHCFWPASHRGALHLYGHTHDQAETFLDGILPGRRSMDVSVDTAYRLLGEYRPFSEDEILAYLLPKPGHWHSRTKPEKQPSSQLEWAA